MGMEVEVVDLLDSDADEEAEGTFGGGCLKLVDQRKIIEPDSDEEEEEKMEPVGDGGGNDKQNDHDPLGSTSGTPRTRGSVCPECQKDYGKRSATEDCGHVKCRQCFISSEDTCRQCVDTDSALSSEDIGETTSYAGDKQDIGNSGKILVEVELPSGEKSRVNVSPETLNQPGHNEVGEDGDEASNSSKITQNKTSDYSSDDDRANDISEGEGDSLDGTPSVDRNAQPQGAIDFNEEEMQDNSDKGENMEDSHEEIKAEEETLGRDHSLEEILGGDDLVDEILSGGERVVKQMLLDSMELTCEGNTETNVEAQNMEDFKEENAGDEEITGDLNEENSGGSGNHNGQVDENVEIKEEQDEDMISVESTPVTNHSNDDIVQRTSGELIGRSTVTSSTKRGKKQGQKSKNDDHIIQLQPEVSGENKVFKCLLCTEEFTQKNHRQIHIYCNPANGKNPYTCSHCQKSCVNGSHLLYHVRSQHTNERPFACKTCNASFHQRDKLNRHLRTHREGGGGPKKPKFPMRRYMCAYCSKEFNEFASCTRHLSMHTEDRPFKCTLCEKTFKIKGSLDAHFKLHSMDKKDRAHKCPDCDATFAMAKDLRRHALRHTGEFPFECTLCTSKCRRKDNFERHLRNNHQLKEAEAKKKSKEALENYEKSKKSRKSKRKPRVVA